MYKDLRKTPYWKYHSHGILNSINEINNFVENGKKIDFATTSNTVVHGICLMNGLFEKDEKIYSKTAERFIRESKQKEISAKYPHYNHQYKNRVKIKNYNGDVPFDEQGLAADIASKKVLLKAFSIVYNNCIVEKIILSDLTYIGLLHIINELDRNVRNHSSYVDFDNKSYIYSMSVLKDENDCVFNFTIADDGQGFEKSLKDYVGDYAVVEAVKRGITARSNWRIIDDDFGRNSGYGLFLLNEICSSKNNSLEILSNGKFFSNDYESSEIKFKQELEIKTNKKEKFIEPTIVNFSISLVNLEQLFDYVNSLGMTDENGKSDWPSKKSTSYKDKKLMNVINAMKDSAEKTHNFIANKAFK